MVCFSPGMEEKLLQSVDMLALIVAVLVQGVLGPVIAGVQGVVVGNVEAVIVRQLSADHRLFQKGIYILLQDRPCM